MVELEVDKEDGWARACSLGGQTLHMWNAADEKYEWSHVDFSLSPIKIDGTCIVVALRTFDFEIYSWQTFKLDELTIQTTWATQAVNETAILISHAGI